MKFLCAALLFAATLGAQVYSPQLLREGQPDPTNLQKLAETIYAHADANTPRQKAEAIWRFFLTDGRFVEPGMIYHIAGWAYEEPAGEVLDPVKLLNSYGFGLCYHIAPLLEAVFQAGGFEDARCWFLTGHTVTEVFYDGGYHYFDSDMMGYNVVGSGSFVGERVASVRDLERNPQIILGKLLEPDKSKPNTVDYPWYPADLREHAMGGLAALFASTKDNCVYPFTRYASGHTMDFVLRPGEKLIRFFEPEEPNLYYLPYQFDGKQWTEFPQEVAEYHVRTADGPRSQKDSRQWGTGRIEYTPPSLQDQRITVVSMPSPYVIIDARFTVTADLPSKTDSLQIETSIDGGGTWSEAGELSGPYHGEWLAEPRVIARSLHGRLTAVSGSYGYDVRITKGEAVRLNQLRLVSRIQLNPRTLPAVRAGKNQFRYTSAPPVERVAIPAPLHQASLRDLKPVEEKGQSFLLPVSGKTGETVFRLSSPSLKLTGFDVGARFLDLRDGLAPDKLTAETRRTTATSSKGDSSILWSTSPDGPFRQLWHSDAEPRWRDGEAIDRVLLWPEVFQRVRDLPSGTATVYVKLRTAGPAIDNVRLAIYGAGPRPSGRLKMTQVWRERGMRHQHEEFVDANATEKSFGFDVGSDVQNEAVVLETIAQ